MRISTAATLATSILTGASLTTAQLSQGPSTSHRISTGSLSAGSLYTQESPPSQRALDSLNAIHPTCHQSEEADMEPATTVFQESVENMKPADTPESLSQSHLQQPTNEEKRYLAHVGATSGNREEMLSRIRGLTRVCNEMGGKVVPKGFEMKIGPITLLNAQGLKCDLEKK